MTPALNIGTDSGAGTVATATTTAAMTTALPVRAAINLQQLNVSRKSVFVAESRALKNELYFRRLAASSSTKTDDTDGGSSFTKAKPL